MEVLSVQNQYPERFTVLTSGTTKAKDWSTPISSSRANKSSSAARATHSSQQHSHVAGTPLDEELIYCDNSDAAAINDLSLRLLDELREAKSRNLTCTEVSIPCDLTTRIASDILRVSEREPCGVRGCTVYIEFEEEPQNSRRIGTLKVDNEMVSTFELYLTLRQDKRGWASLLPQFMKNLSRSITISPDYSLTKHKLYSPCESS
ncbi:protein scylla-like [Musca vetustissima]|uniref:protein scylla-like n=1 Tax=Musca vetustissima TaxID=27455 RepID=UPI002AB67424|nr:protein scylla-like [Musca vetustissima]